MWLLGLFVAAVGAAFISTTVLQVVEIDIEMEAIDRENARVEELTLQLEQMQTVLDAERHTFTIDRDCRLLFPGLYRRLLYAE